MELVTQFVTGNTDESCQCHVLMNKGKAVNVTNTTWKRLVEGKTHPFCRSASDAAISLRHTVLLVWEPNF